MADTLFVIRHDIMRSLRRSKSQIEADFAATIAALRTPFGMLLAERNLKTACDFIRGYDAALRGVPLNGFYYWLTLKGGDGGDTRYWPQKLERMARELAGRSASPERVLDAGCRIIEKFLAYRRRYGVRKVAARCMALRGRYLASRAARGRTATGRRSGSRG
jgi:hypothetical protein